MKGRGQHNESPFCCHIFEFDPHVERLERHKKGMLTAVFLPAVPRVGDRIVDDTGSPGACGYYVHEVWFVTSDNGIELHCSWFTPYENDRSEP